MNPVIEAQDISFAYQNIPVIRHVSCTVNQGECIGIIGPNGGGKTTFLKIIMGFIKQKSGAIHVFGHSPHEVEERIGYVPQALRFDRQFPISVMELVLMGCMKDLPWYGRFSKKEKQKALEALELMGIPDLGSKAFGQLSGGQMQRALIARALVSDPDLLLLDEPTANVDSAAEEIIYEIIDSLRSKKTILLITHDLHTVLDKVDRVFCMQGDLISLQPKEVCEHYAIGLYHRPLLKVEEP